MCVTVTDSASALTSFTARTVTVWAVAQLPVVNVKLVGGVTVTAPASRLVAVTVTVADGSLSSTTVYEPSAPPSTTPTGPDPAVTPATSSSVTLTSTGVPTKLL